MLCDDGRVILRKIDHVMTEGARPGLVANRGLTTGDQTEFSSRKLSAKIGEELVKERQEIRHYVILY